MMIDKFYHIAHFSFGFILSIPSLQPNADENSLLFDNVPTTLNSAANKFKNQNKFYY